MESEVLTREECAIRLGMVDVGHVAVTLDALPAIFAVRFALLGDAIYFAALPSSRLAQATRSSIVAFQADQFDETSLSGWSVHAVGASSWEADPVLREQTLASFQEAWWQTYRDGQIVRVGITRLTGKRFSLDP